MDKINSINGLSYDDKNILMHAYQTYNISLCMNMSIFSKLGNYYNLDEYRYFKTLENEDIYYINLWNNGGYYMFIDKNKKILFLSRYIFDNAQWLLENLENIINFLNTIDLSDCNNIIDIGTNIIAIQSWFITYGHFKDEIFNLSNFYDKISTNGYDYKILLDYHMDNELIKHYPFNNNYNIIKNYLCDNSINAYTYKRKLLKMRNVHLIENGYNSSTFHSFPYNITQKILSKIDNTIYPQLFHNDVFISRNKALHMPRMLDNLNEIEDYFISKNFISVNPEILTYEQFINSIRNANRIIITWGGALTNLIYLKPNTQVIILQSKSYEHETIDLFNKIINTYKLNIKIIRHTNNMVNLSEFNFIE